MDYSGRIPAAEYVDILDTAETRRIREITNQLLGAGSQPDSALELRERVRSLNAEIRKLDRNTVDTANIDVVGDLAKAGTAPYGLKIIADLLALPTLRRAGAMVLERTIDDTRLGDAVDRFRGALNGVSAQAIRVYRLRRKLSP